MRRKNTIVALGLAMCMLFTACGDSKKEKLAADYNAVASSESEVTATDKAAKKQFKDDGIIPSEFELGITATKYNEIVSFDENDELDEGAEYDLKVKCKTDITSLDSIMVYDVEKVSVDDNYIIDLADKIFDDGNYKVLNPFGTMTNEELDKIDKEYTDNGVYGADSFGAVLPLMCYKYYEPVEMEEGKVIVDTKTFGGAKECRLRGMMSGREYELTYLGVGDVNNISIYQTYTDHKYMDSTKYPQGIWPSGTSLVSQSEADTWVEDFMNKLALIDFEKASVCTRWSDLGDDRNDVHGDCGYIYTYKRNIGGIQPIDYFDGFVRYESDVNRSNGEGDGCVPRQLLDGDKVQIEVDDTGIVSVVIRAFNNPVAMQKEEINRLTFDQCMEMAKYPLSTRADLIEMNDHIDLEKEGLYVRLVYQYINQDGHEVYIPILTFERCEEDDTEGDIYKPGRAYFGVSLLDGSTVCFGHLGKYDQYDLESIFHENGASIEE